MLIGYVKYHSQEGKFMLLRQILNEYLSSSHSIILKLLSILRRSLPGISPRITPGITKYH